MTRLVMSALVVAIATLPLEARSQKPDRRALTRTVDSIVTAMMGARGTPGVSVLVAYGDSVFLAKGYGVSDLDDDAPASPQTVYNVASLTKQFAAAGLVGSITLSFGSRTIELKRIG
jgi:D-alanyl-D-alanine carboxypeptidase